MSRHHREFHRLDRLGWLRAAVLGANDGIVSTASLVLGVAAANAAQDAVVTAAMAGLVSGAMSMATGEYVSVQSQADAERAALELERRELQDNPQGERGELERLYVTRGLDPGLARQVATALMARDALAAHARDELGISPALMARPLQAALASAASFAAGAALPLLVVLLSPPDVLPQVTAVASVVLLAILGGWAARAGGASAGRGALRVVFWSVLSMAAASTAGTLFGAVSR